MTFSAAQAVTLRHGCLYFLLINPNHGCQYQPRLLCKTSTVAIVSAQALIGISSASACTCSNVSKSKPPQGDTFDARCNGTSCRSLLSTRTYSFPQRLAGSSSTR